jgi:hypothetical protein
MDISGYSGATLQRPRLERLRLFQGFKGRNIVSDYFRNLHNGQHLAGVD